MNNDYIDNMYETLNLLHRNQQLGSKYYKIMNERRGIEKLPLKFWILVFGAIFFYFCNQYYIDAKRGFWKFTKIPIYFMPVILAIPVSGIIDDIAQNRRLRRLERNRSKVEALSREYTENKYLLDNFSQVPPRYRNIATLEFFVEHHKSGNGCTLQDFINELERENAHRSRMNMTLVFEPYKNNYRNYDKDLYMKQYYNNSHDISVDSTIKKNKKRKKKFKRQGKSISKIREDISSAEDKLSKEPNISMMQVRSIAEDLIKKIAYCENIEIVPIGSQIDRINYLHKYRVLSDHQAKTLHTIRKIGNIAVHEGYSDLNDARQIISELKYMFSLFESKYTVES